MAAPASKATDLLGQFISILASGRTFQGVEELQYYRELSAFPEGELGGDQLRAFYYACNNNESRAISYFKKSLAYNEPDFMENYLIYLMQRGLIKLYIAETIKANEHLSNNPKLLAQLARAYLFKGDFKGMINTRKNLEKLGEKFVLFLDDEIRDLDYFKRNLDLNDEQLRFLIDTSVNIAEKNKIDVINIDFEYFEEGGEVFNSFVFYTRCDDTNLLVDMDFELVQAIAKNPAFTRKRFSPSFEYFEYEQDEKDADYVRQVL